MTTKDTKDTIPATIVAPTGGPTKDAVAELTKDPVKDPVAELEASARLSKADEARKAELQRVRDEANAAERRGTAEDDEPTFENLTQQSMYGANLSAYMNLGMPREEAKRLALKRAKQQVNPEAEEIERKRILDAQQQKRRAAGG